MHLWTPNSQEWAGQDAHLIGGGSSLKFFNFSRLAPYNVIGCNDAFHLGACIVKYLLFGDVSWWQRNRHALEHYPGKIVTNSEGMVQFNLPNIYKMARARDGLHSGSTLGWNYSTGAAAINLALSLGAARLFLLGYDLSNQNAVSHWHPHNPKPIAEYAFQRFLRGFACVQAALPPGVTVYNVTDGSSRLECFERISFEDYYARAFRGEEVTA